MNFFKKICKNFIFIPIQIISPIVFFDIFGISYDYIDFTLSFISILLCVCLILCFESFLVKVFVSAFLTGPIYGALFIYGLLFVCRFDGNCL